MDGREKFVHLDCVPLSPLRRNANNKLVPGAKRWYEATSDEETSEGEEIYEFIDKHMIRCNRTFFKRNVPREFVQTCVYK